MHTLIRTRRIDITGHQQRLISIHPGTDKSSIPAWEAGSSAGRDSSQNIIISLRAWRLGAGALDSSTWELGESGRKLLFVWGGLASRPVPSRPSDNYQEGEKNEPPPDSSLEIISPRTSSLLLVQGPGVVRLPEVYFRRFASRCFCKSS